MKTVSIINLKGGVGKTVTAINMASILATEHGERVLVIDADPQANATRFFGAEVAPATLSDLFQGRVMVDEYEQITWPTQVVGVDVIPADMGLLEFDIAAARAGGISSRIGDMCAEMDARDEYSFCIIDCPPGFTAVSISGISASDAVIIPTTVDAFSISGLQEISAQVRGVAQIKPGLHVAGVLVTLWHNAAVVTQGEQFLRAMDVPVFETTIRRTDKIGESTFARQPISEYSRWCSAARDYREFVAEFLEKEGGV